MVFSYTNICTNCVFCKREEDQERVVRPWSSDRSRCLALCFALHTFGTLPQYLNATALLSANANHIHLLQRVLSPDDCFQQDQLSRAKLKLPQTGLSNVLKWMIINILAPATA